MWFGALLSYEQTQEFIQIANFANDKPGISIGFSRTAAFWMQDKCEGGGGQTCQTFTNAHFQPPGGELSEHADLTASNVCAYPEGNRQD